MSWKKLEIAGVVLGVLAVFVGAATLSYTRQQQRVKQAAACAHMTYEQFEQLAESSAGKSHLSVRESEELLIAYACPAMARR